MARASAPGKVILLGEHAVVYGEPAIATAIDLRTTVSAAATARPPGAHAVNRAPMAEHAHAHLLHAVRALWPEGRPGLDLTTESRIPSAAGLGSSAALSAATCAAVLAEAGDAVEEERVARAAYEAEWTVQGGRGSPTDTTTVTHGAAVLVDRERRENPLWTVERPPRRWHLHHLDVPDLKLVVGYTGTRGRTADQVAKVARFVARTGFAMDVIRDIGAVVREGLAALRGKDVEKLGRLMDRDHNLLTILGVSTPDLDRLCAAARATSYGAKLTGSGGGGSMIALTEKPEATAEAIRRAGGTPYVVTPGAAGVRVE